MTCKTDKNFEEIIPDKVVRDLLTQDEITQLKQLETHGRKGLVALINSTGSFAGYYPLNAGLPDGLKPHRVNDELDVLPIVAGG